MLTKLVRLNQVTLAPHLLYATAPDAPNGIVHADAVRVVVDDGDGAKFTRENESSDVKIKDAAICQKARELYELCATKLSEDAGSPVVHRADAPPISAAL